MKTITQTTLFDLDTRSRLQKDFVEFDAANPDVWREFRGMALRLIEEGYKHYGAKSIIEAIRFHRNVSKHTGGGPFRINNNLTAYYARKFHKKYPQYNGFFETREVKGENE